MLNSLQTNAFKQSGFGLVESLITLLVISVGLLGIAALQITSLKQSASAQAHTQAVWYSYEMTDRIAANSSAFASYADIDTKTVSSSTDCEGSTCTPAQMAAADAEDWRDMVVNLPAGRGYISSPAANTLTVSVMWDDDAEISNCVNGEPEPDGMTCYTVTTTTVVPLP